MTAARTRLRRRRPRAPRRSSSPQPPRAPEDARRRQRQLIWMTCALDHLEHALTWDNAALGTAHGRYLAICGHEVFARPLTCPPGPRCPHCFNSDPIDQATPGIWARLFSLAHTRWPLSLHQRAAPGKRPVSKPGPSPVPSHQRPIEEIRDGRTRPARSAVLDQAQHFRQEEEAESGAPSRIECITASDQATVRGYSRGQNGRSAALRGRTRSGPGRRWERL